MAQYTIGIDVGGTKTAYGLFDSNKNIVERIKKPSNPKHNGEQFFDEIAASVSDIMNRYNINVSNLRGIGIGMPSFINYEDGHIVKTTNLVNINNFPAKSYLSQKLGNGIRIIIDSDSRTGALAEHRYGAGRGFENMLYCPVSTGISSGIIIEGKLFRGRYGWAGESGHMIVTPGESIDCGCGNRGCIMSWCSGSMIEKHVKNWIHSGEKSILPELAGSMENITTFHINEAYDLSDALAIKAIEQMALYMGIWLYNLYVLLNINCFVFGGGLVAMGDKLFSRIKKHFAGYNQNDMPVYFRFAELEADFGIIGAAELLF